MIVRPQQEAVLLLHGLWLNRLAVLTLPHAPSSAVYSVERISLSA